MKKDEKTKHGTRDFPFFVYHKNKPLFSVYLGVCVCVWKIKNKVFVLNERQADKQKDVK